MITAVRLMALAGYIVVWTAAAQSFVTSGKGKPSLRTSGPSYISLRNIQSSSKSTAMGSKDRPLENQSASNKSHKKHRLSATSGAGVLDSTFGVNGTAMAFISGGVTPGVWFEHSAAIQPDGKIVIAGDASLNTVGGDAFAVARFDTNGELDKTFGYNGGATSGGGSGVVDDGNSVAIQADGKIIVAGSSWYNNGVKSGYEFALVRFNSNGTVDNTFGTGGTVKTPINGGDSTGDYGNSVVIQQDGKILVAGISGGSKGDAFAIARFNTDGTLDNAFGNNGSTIASVRGGIGDDRSYAITLQPDGKILLAGYSTDSTTRVEFGLVRLNPDGGLDNSFGNNGSVRTFITGGSNFSDEAKSVAVQSDGKIVLGGYSEDVNGHYAFAIARFDSTGVLDNSFGSSGTVRAYISGGDSTDYGYSIALQPDGKIVTAGYSGPLANGDGASVMRFNSDGSIDESFGKGGSSIIDAPVPFVGAGDDSYDHFLALQDNGKILVAPYCGEGVFLLARLNSQGIPDSATFGTNGMALTYTDLAINPGEGDCSAIQSDGKVVVGGYSWFGETAASGLGDAFTLARFDSDGELDTTFDHNGSAVALIGGYSIFGSFRDDEGKSVVIQPDGKIVLAGYSDCGANHYSFAVARFNPDGTLDNTFGENGTVRPYVAGGDTDDYGNSVALQPDGKIVVAGYSKDASSNSAFAVVRLNTDGSLDHTFGANGSVRAFVAGGNGSDDEGYSVAIQKDGKIVVAGYSSGGYLDHAFALIRLNPNGAPDNTFGTGGSVRVHLEGSDSYDEGHSVIIRQDGKILVTGYSNSIAFEGLAVVRFSSNGSVDTAFGNNGVAHTTAIGGTGTTCSVIQLDGKIDCVNYGSAIPFAVARFDTLGGMDSSFGTNGVASASINGGEGKDFASSVAIQSDGKIVVAGTSDMPDSTNKYAFSVARFLPGTPLEVVPSPPMLLSPLVTVSVPRRATLIWKQSTNAISYRLQIASDSLFATIVLDTVTADTSVKLVNPLEPVENYYWRVNATDSGGTGLYSNEGRFTTGTGLDAVKGGAGIPKAFKLYQNYPNPFNPSTFISYDLPKAVHVTLQIFDILGRHVVTLVDGNMAAGSYRATFDGSRFASGVYFYRIHAGDFTAAKKLMLLK